MVVVVDKTNMLKVMIMWMEIKFRETPWEDENGRRGRNNLRCGCMKKVLIN